MMKYIVATLGAYYKWIVSHLVRESLSQIGGAFVINNFLCATFM